MGKSTEKESRLRSKSPRLIIPIVAVAAILLLLGVSLWLNELNFGRPTMIIRFDKATFGSNGWVTFNLTSFYDVNVTITAVKGYLCCLNGTYLGTVSPSSNKIIPAGGTLSLAVQFQGVTWQTNVRYVFMLSDDHGDKIGAYGTP